MDKNISAKNRNHMVSIITPMYNSQAFIEQAIDSVIQQTHKRWEMIIVDDASTDASVAIVESIAKTDSRIKLLQLATNQGVAKARNAAIAIAKGRFIAFLDSDDIWYPQKLEVQLNKLTTSQQALIYSSYQLINESGRNKSLYRIPKDKIYYQDLLKTNIIACSSAMYDRAIIGTKYLMPHAIEDYILWLEILKESKYAIGCYEDLLYYRLRKKSLSSNKVYAAKQRWLVYRKIEKLSLMSSVYFFLNYMIKSGLKNIMYHIK